MSITEIKQEIKSEIDKVTDERLLNEIDRLLHQDEAEITEWHKEIILQRLNESESDDGEMLDWQEVKNSL